MEENEKIEIAQLVALRHLINTVFEKEKEIFRFRELQGLHWVDA